MDNTFAYIKHVMMCDFGYMEQELRIGRKNQNANPNSKELLTSCRKFPVDILRRI
jgi:hypothetical protein